MSKKKKQRGIFSKLDYILIIVIATIGFGVLLFAVGAILTVLAA